MGIVKMLIYEGFRTARANAKAGAVAGPKDVTMKQLGKTGVTRSDFEQLSGHMESIRSDMHKGMTDLFNQARENDHYLFEQMTKLTYAVNVHSETLKELLDVIKAHGLG